MIESLGIVGTGHLSGFVCEGLRKTNWNGKLLVSAHNPSKAQVFQDKFGAEILTDNQSVVEQCQAVFVAVRPMQVEAALSGLNWRPEQLLVSAMAGVKIDLLQRLAPPAVVVRTMPISSAALCASPTSYFPENEIVRDLLSLIGVAIAMGSEAEFEAASANGAAYGWYFALIDEIVQANVRAGLPKVHAKKVAIETLAAAAKVALASDESGADILKSLATPGGVTAHGLGVLTKQQALRPWGKAFDAVISRLKG
ncbi:NAD(P)-binding domain-containing protein [Alphaproteobacteria bacterium]|nr:NAD(P)-binding domain-containing protein [Alphaproteobacteria bacterium]